MCTIVDGYKLYRVFDKMTVAHEVAGFGNEDAVYRAKLRGIEDPQYAQWHELYREYVQEIDPIERDSIRLEIQDRIWDDIGSHP